MSLVVKGDVSSAIMGTILVGICLGYLRYNIFPAKILMGDAGATFLGFILGLISLNGAFKQATVISFLVPVFALGLPIFDNFYVVFKRIKEKKPIYVGDTNQVHFRLLKSGPQSEAGRQLPVSRQLVPEPGGDHYLHPEIAVPKQIQPRQPAGHLHVRGKR